MALPLLLKIYHQSHKKDEISVRSLSFLVKISENLSEEILPVFVQNTENILSCLSGLRNIFLVKQLLKIIENIALKSECREILVQRGVIKVMNSLRKRFNFY